MRNHFFDQLGGSKIADRSGSNVNSSPSVGKVQPAKLPARSRFRAGRWALGAVLIGLAILIWFGFAHRPGGPLGPPGVPLAHVTVSQPLVRNVDTRIGLLGQFSAINRVELRAQVGGTLTEIHFQDGQIVNKGDLLFVIDPRPYEIKLARANALLQTASSRSSLATSELARAQSLQKSSFATPETVDQRTSELNAAQAAIDDAKAQIRDAQLDLEYTRITAPFTGRIGARLVSIGSLIAGSRGASSPTTLLTTLVSLDPLYLDFDMSESDYLAFARERERVSGRLANQIVFSLGDENKFVRTGTLDFVDNSLDRSSGTIHVRATVPNADLFLVPGEFARIRVAIAPPTPTLLVPDAAVTLDQSQHMVMTVSTDGTVVPKPVETGDLRGGLRVIQAGLDKIDRVIIDGVVHAVPGSKVEAQDGTIQYDGTADTQR
ncbi:MAG: efflux transporter periplasmic adaptor subunit [Proteobacteria bacterium]|nr:MAG: efflux transporter periplasmic adaptor subunit [Pseudomonadota bacterium]